MLAAEERLRAAAWLCQPDRTLCRRAAIRLVLALSNRDLGRLQPSSVLYPPPAAADLAVIARDPGMRALLRALLPEELVPWTFTALMEALELETGAAIPGLERLLEDRTPAIRLGAAVALSLLGAPAAALALRRALPAASPPVFLLALQALALVDDIAAVPLLGVFCLSAPLTSFQSLPEAQLGIIARTPDFGGLPLGQLVRVHAWFRQLAPREEVGRTAAWGSGGPEGTGRDLAPPDDFARVALWNLGCKELLVPIDALSAGRGDAIVAARDPRLFATLAVALLRHRGMEPGQQIGLAAIRGLLALGEPRCLALLRWFGSVWRRPASDPTVWQQARAAATCLRERLGAVGGELVPAGTPAGRGTELAGDGER